MPDFIIDTQLPPRLASLFVERGFNAIHTTYFPEGHLLKDSEIIDIAIKQNKIILTKDKDFFDYYNLKGAPPKILFIQLGNISNQDLITKLKFNFNRLIDQFQNNDFLILNEYRILAYSK